MSAAPTLVARCRSLALPVFSSAGRGRRLSGRSFVGAASSAAAAAGRRRSPPPPASHPRRSRGDAVAAAAASSRPAGAGGRSRRPPPSRPPPPSAADSAVAAEARAATAKSSNLGGADTDVKKATDNRGFISEHLVDPGRAVFPWRHSAAPLPRLVPDSEESRDGGGAFGPGLPPLDVYVRWVMRWNAAAAMGEPAWRALLFRGRWEDELAGHFADAFGTGVAGMLADAYDVPIEEVVSQPSSPPKEGAEAGETAGNGGGGGGGMDGSAARFDRTLDPLPEITDIVDEMEAQAREGREGRPRWGGCCPEAELMLERHLRSLYRTAREHGRHRLRIRLETVPRLARVESMFCVPCLTRSHVERTPALRHSFRNMWKHLEREEREVGRGLRPWEVVRELSDELEKLARRTVDKDGVLESTVIAQVSVRCDEVFTVRDVELDEVIQGDPLSRVNDVVHLVRFEMVVRASIEDGKPQLGSWQITDWDDLLGGNIWFI